jgi:hypothetical protein
MHGSHFGPKNGVASPGLAYIVSTNVVQEEASKPKKKWFEMLNLGGGIVCGV